MFIAGKLGKRRPDLSVAEMLKNLTNRCNVAPWQVVFNDIYARKLHL